jgi:Photosynthetic reaction centre cytochrome C subunit
MPSGQMNVFHLMNKKIIVYTGIILFMTAGMAATHTPGEKPEWKNLKVMPKNIDEEQMERVMYRYTRQLGVTCIFCHPQTKPGIVPIRIDFATDEIPQKITARNMMRMTDKINRKYFGYKNDYSFNSLSNKIGITCTTCHRGISKPSNLRLYFNE